MASKSLTDVVVKNLSPAPKQFEVWDTKIPAFGIRVSPKGAKSFVLLYRFKGTRKRLTLGRYPTLGLADARKLANDALRSVSLGSDPAEAKRAHRNSHGDTFADFVTSYATNYAKRNRSWPETERLLFREFVSKWGKLKTKDITKRHVTDALDAIVHRGTPSAANHAFAAIRGLFNWGAERELIERSPCEKLRKPALALSRDRVLNSTELAAIWNGAEAIAYPFGRIVQLLILTGQRREEVAGMRWKELDLEAAVWFLPGERTKAARSHQVPLSKEAVAILREIPRVNDELVFPARGSTVNAFSGFSKAKKKLDATARVTEWRLHDIRRTVSTGMARMQVRIEVVEKLLNHSSGKLSGVAGIYNRFDYLGEMRDAVEMWSLHVQQITSGSVTPETGNQLPPKKAS